MKSFVLVVRGLLVMCFAAEAQSTAVATPTNLTAAAAAAAVPITPIDTTTVSSTSVSAAATTTSLAAAAAAVPITPVETTTQAVTTTTVSSTSVSAAATTTAAPTIIGDLYPCNSNPCRNGATCRNDYYGGYNCSCPYGYTGQQCQTSHCPQGWYNFGNFCYKFSSTRLSWENAENTCQSSGGHLASITSQAEQDFISLRKYITDFWIGYNDRANESRFIWSDGSSPEAYENWNQDEPNNMGGNEDCAYVIFHSAKWNDEPCGRLRGFICKRKPELYPCNSNPCRNNGTCNGGIGWYRCSCPYGYTGKQCQTYLYPCNSYPCRNGGTCNNDYHGGYNCSCPYEYTGRQCQSYLYPCNSNPCRNNGTCNGGIGWYRCSCPYGYTGKQCQTYLYPCNSNPCRNGATCRNDYYGGYNCSCPYGYTGQQCQSHCPQGWDNFGSFCYKFSSTRLSWENAENTCQSSGGHLASITSQAEQDFISLRKYITDFWIGYNDRANESRFIWSDGSNPEAYENWNQDEPNNMGGNENCTYLIFYSAKWNDEPCERLRGFICKRKSGTNNTCASSPCRNNGTCFTTYDGYRCYCPYGYSGRQCETNVYPCNSNPCGNGGSCYGGYGLYRCSCRYGYTGQHCQTYMNFCASWPCRNGGTCHNIYYINGSECSCPSGFTGKQCETNLKTSVTCGENFMQIDLIDRYFPGLDWRTLHLENTTCRATKTAYSMRLSAPLDGCGVTYVEHDKKITFWNKVRNELVLWPGWGGNYSAITRGENLVIPFYCEYGREKIVSTNFNPSRKRVYASEGSYGNFTFTMDLYYTSNYRTPYSVFAYPVVVYPNQPLWVQYEVKNTNADLVVFAENCRATTTTNPDSFPQHVFLQRGCVRDPTMVYWYNPYSNVQRFSIKSFRFVYSNTFLVYLHCELIVCHRNSTNSRCAQGCISSRRRREAEEIDGSIKYDLSAGPLKGPNTDTGTDKQGAGETSSANTAIIGSVSALAVVGLLVAILLSVKMFHARRNRLPPKETPPPAIVMDQTVDMNETVNSYEQHVIQDDEIMEIEI